MQDLKTRTLQGGFAKLVAQGVGFVVRIASLMILARLLDPRDFGLVAMVTVVTGIFSLFRDAGLSMVTIQRPSISDREISALFWINLLVGGVLALVSVAAAPVLSAFYREPKLFWVTIALAMGFVLNAAGVQHSAVLQRRMRFGTLAAIEITAQFASVAVGIAMALTGAGYWALVAMSLVIPAVSSAGFWLTSNWFPMKPRREPGIGSMIRFGGTMTLNGIIVYVAYNLDKLLLGKIWGAEALGIYGRAYQLVNIPTDNLNYAIGGVAVSALSRLQDDPARFRSYFLKGYTLVLAMTIPVTVTCALFADDVVSVLLGSKWVSATPIFRLLAPTILGLALINPLAWVLFSTGRVKRSLHMAMVIMPAVILGYVAGLPYGPQGVAFGYSTAMLVLIVPMIVWALRGLSIPARDIIAAVRPPFLASMAGALVGFGVRALTGPALSPLARLILEVAALSATYIATLLYAFGQKDFYINLVRDVTKRPTERSIA